MWQDEAFPASNSSLFFNPQHDEEMLYWKRPCDLCTVPTLTGKQIDSIPVQGNLGNCWLICSIYALAKSKTAWRKVFELANVDFCDRDYNGQIVVQLWVNGSWKKITIDDRLPTKYLNGQYELVYSSCDEPSQFWVPLLEKACAKLYSCYESLTSGRVCEGYLLLTGGYTWSDQVLHKRNIENLIAKIDVVNRKESPVNNECDAQVFISCDKALTNDNVNDAAMELHCYVLLDIDADGNVKVWNPWRSHGESKLSCSYESVPLSTLIQFQPLVTYSTMNLELVFHSFSTGSTNSHSLNWKEKLLHCEWKALQSSGGNRQSCTYYKNPQIYVKLNNTLNQQSILHVTLLLISKRNSDKRKLLEQAAGMHIYCGNSKPNCALSLQQLKSLSCISSTQPEYDYSHHRSAMLVPMCVTKTDKFHHLIIVPSTFSCNINCGFLVRILCSTNIDEFILLS